MSLFTFHMQEFKGKVAGIKADCVDTTGAGDSFVGSVLNSLASDPELFMVYTSFHYQVILVENAFNHSPSQLRYTLLSFTK